MFMILLQGKVETEVITEFKEVQDDSDFSGILPASTSSDNIKAIEEAIKNNKFPDKTSNDKIPVENLTKESRKQHSVDYEAKADNPKFANDALVAHNEKRKKHGVQALKLSEQVCCRLLSSRMRINSI